MFCQPNSLDLVPLIGTNKECRHFFFSLMNIPIIFLFIQETLSQLILAHYRQPCPCVCERAQLGSVKQRHLVTHSLYSVCDVARQA